MNITILGKGNGTPLADEVARLRREMADATRRRAEMTGHVAELEGRYIAADGWDDAESILVELRETKRQLTRLQQEVPKMETAIATAQADRMKADILRLRRECLPLYRELRTVLIATAEINKRVLDWREAAKAAIGENAVITNIPIQSYIGFALPEFVEIWVKEQDRIVNDVEKNETVNLPTPRSNKLSDLPPIFGFQLPTRVGGVPQDVLDAVASSAKPKKPPPPMVMPTAEPKPRPRRSLARIMGSMTDGMRAIRYLTSNIQRPDGVLSLPGDEVAVSKEIAGVLVDKGSAEFVNEEPGPAEPSLPLGGRVDGSSHE